MTPKIIHARPPNFAAIVAAFPAAAKPGTIFAYGDTIYTLEDSLPHSLVEHEKVHLRQQNESGGPEIWWEFYLSSSQFRFDAELEAHIVEYATVLSSGANRIARRRARAAIAARLSGPLYGKCTSRAKAEAFLRAVEEQRRG